MFDKEEATPTNMCNQDAAHNTQYQQQLFLPQTIQDWNTVPQNTVEATIIDTFVSRASKPAT